MPTYVVKPDAHEDFYVLWSTVVDNWTFAGTRAEVLDYERRNLGGMQAIDPAHRPEARFDRADVNGTSAMWPEEKAGPDKYLGWNDEEFMVANDADPEVPGQFLIRRADLRRYVEQGSADVWFAIPDDEDL